MKNASLNKRLKQYSTLAGCFLIGSKVTEAQIVYTNINPDVVSLNSGYDLDLNNDGIVEYTFTSYFYSSTTGSSSSAYVYVSPQPGNAVAGFEEYPLVFEKGDPIDNRLGWDDRAEAQYLASFFYSGSGTDPFSSYGNWLGEEKKYLALRFNIHGEDHYGWVRLSVGSRGAPLTIFDYAYEKTPNKMIAAADIGSAIFYADVDNDNYGDANASAITFFADPGTGYSTVNSDCDDVNADVHPGKVEDCKNGIDDDCNGRVDELASGELDPAVTFTFNCSPNPAHGNITINGQTPQEGPLDIKLLDLTGRELIAINEENVSGNFSRRLDTGGVSSGTYFLQVKHSGVGEMKKIVIAN